MTDHSTTAAFDFTARRLFGSRDADALANAEFLDRARIERQRKHQAGTDCALGAYVVVRLVDRWIEQGQPSEDEGAFDWQLQSARRRVKALPQGRPDVASLQDILDAVSHGQAPEAVWVALMSLSYFLEHEERWAEALAVLRLAARTHRGTFRPADFAGIALQAGRLFRLSAVWDQAQAAYAAAEEAARVLDDEPLALRAALGQARVLHGQGETAASLAAVERTLAAASGSGLEDHRGDAYTLLSTLLRLQGHLLAGIDAAYQAVRLASPPTRGKPLLDLGTALAYEGYRAPARLALLAVTGSPTLRASAHLALLELASDSGDRLAFERHRSRLSAIGCLPPGVAVDFQFRLGMGLARFQQLARARVAWTDGMALAEEHGLTEWYCRLEERLQDEPGELQAHSSTEPPDEAPPLVVEIEAWLKTLASG